MPVQLDDQWGSPMTPKPPLSYFVLAAVMSSASAQAAEGIVPIIVLGKEEAELAPHVTMYLPVIITGTNKSGPFLAVFDPNLTDLSPENLPTTLFETNLEGCEDQEATWCWPRR